MLKHYVLSLFALTAFTLAIHASVSTAAPVPVPAPKAPACECASDFECLFGNFGCSGFVCRKRPGFPLGFCTVLER